MSETKQGYKNPEIEKPTERKLVEILPLETSTEPVESLYDTDHEKFWYKGRPITPFAWREKQLEQTAETIFANGENTPDPDFEDGSFIQTQTVESFFDNVENTPGPDVDPIVVEGNDFVSTGNADLTTETLTDGSNVQ